MKHCCCLFVDFLVLVDKVRVLSFPFDAFLRECPLDFDIVFLRFGELLKEGADERRDLLTSRSDGDAVVYSAKLFVEQLFAGNFLVCKEPRQRSFQLFVVGKDVS